MDAVLANVTLERFFSKLNYFVCVQEPTICKTFLTNLTFICFLPEWILWYWISSCTFGTSFLLQWIFLWLIKLPLSLKLFLQISPEWVPIFTLIEALLSNVDLERFFSRKNHFVFTICKALLTNPTFICFVLPELFPLWLLKYSLTLNIFMHILH